MIKDTLIEIANNFNQLSLERTEDIKSASDLMIKCLKENNKIMFCGNGGSAADSQHLAAELLGRYRKNRKALSALALTTDTSSITAIANDFSFEDIYARQIEALGKKNDVLFAISTSGNSTNIVNAIIAAKKLEINVIGLTGKDGGKMNGVCDVLIKVPSIRPDRIQEMHIAMGQILCDIVESTLC